MFKGISKATATARLNSSLLCRRFISGEPQEEKSRLVAALWGNGDFGRLGLGTCTSQWKPVICSALLHQNLRHVACGGAHTLFLTETGRVYATGLNDFGQLGISNDITHTNEPLEVSGLPDEILRSCQRGIRLYLFLYWDNAHLPSAQGELFMWGKNSTGQLGLGKKAAKALLKPSKVDCMSGITIRIAALGSEHTLALTGEGEVLSWGGGGSGRLGHGYSSGIFEFLRSTVEYTPRLIKSLEGVKVKNIAAGLMHSACVDEFGSVFVFGERPMNKLGFEGVNHASTPSMIRRVPFSEQISCGGYHTCVITGGMELFTWGSNENGCLGIGYTDPCHSPERVEGPFLNSPVEKVSCGWKHTAAISEGKIYTWGWGGSNGTFSEDGNSSGGQLGHGDDFDYDKPAIVNFGSNVKALQVSCGFNHTAAILEYT